MRAPRCTIDSSCVIALDHLDLLPQLSFLFSLVLAPKAVRDDIFKRRATKKRVRSLFDQYAFFERCDDYDRGTVDFLLAERAREAMKDRGEVEAIVQAAQSGATVIVDDPWGRILAERYDLDFPRHGLGSGAILRTRLDLGSGSSREFCRAPGSRNQTALGRRQ
jgi:predicted nucleic acid-binding protein